MIGIVEIVGVDVALDLFNKTKDIESKGGMMIKNGERRRTPGGVFMQLLRDAGNFFKTFLAHAAGYKNRFV